MGQIAVVDMANWLAGFWGCPVARGRSSRGAVNGCGAAAVLVTVVVTVGWLGAAEGDCVTVFVTVLVTVMVGVLVAL